MTKTKAASLPKQESRGNESQVASIDSSKSIREGFHTITPYLAVREAPELIEFVKQAFGAEGQIYGIGSQGGLHAEYKIGDSITDHDSAMARSKSSGMRASMNCVSKLHATIGLSG